MVRRRMWAVSSSLKWNVVTGSTAASKGNPAFGVYAASKAALRSFTRT
jgi:NAD(P)-dependent dehydrogenase (short-subunit alcohol dehydrogenase family)